MSVAGKYVIFVWYHLLHKLLYTKPYNVKKQQGNYIYLFPNFNQWWEWSIGFKLYGLFKKERLSLQDDSAK